MVHGDALGGNARCSDCTTQTHSFCLIKTNTRGAACALGQPGLRGGRLRSRPGYLHAHIAGLSSGRSPICIEKPGRSLGLVAEIAFDVAHFDSVRVCQIARL